MPRNVTKIRIFIASPGDTSDERAAASEIVEELNKINSFDNIEYELIKWETHAFSGIGEDAQDVINKQINSDYDIFVGLMWRRFGSPTKRASSGTEEEFNRAVQIYKSNEKPIKIMFYFNQTPVSMGEIDVEQLVKINQFKLQLKEQGVLYWDYSGLKQFEGLLRVQLSKSAKELIDELNLKRTDIVKVETELVDINEEEPGLIDLIVQASDDFEEIGGVLSRMTVLMTELGEKMTKRAEEINSVDTRLLKPQELKRLVDKSSNDMQIYVRRMETEMPIFKESMTSGFDLLTKAYSIYYTDWGKFSKDEVESFQKLEELLESMESFLTAMHELKYKITTMPRATTNFNKAKKDTEKIIKRLINEVDTALNQVKEIKKLREEL